jgi:hypothetical protein
MGVGKAPREIQGIFFSKSGYALNKVGMFGFSDDRGGFIFIKIALA